MGEFATARVRPQSSQGAIRGFWETAKNSFNRSATSLRLSPEKGFVRSDIEQVILRGDALCFERAWARLLVAEAEVRGVWRSVCRYRARWRTQGHQRAFLFRQAARGRKGGTASGVARRVGTLLEHDRTPWESAGVSRATWYRRGENWRRKSGGEGRETEANTDRLISKPVYPMCYIGPWRRGRCAPPSNPPPRAHAAPSPSSASPRHRTRPREQSRAGRVAGQGRRGGRVAVRAAAPGDGADASASARGQIARIGSNLNQIARWAHTHVDDDIAVVEVLAHLVAIERDLAQLRGRGAGDAG